MTILEEEYEETMGRVKLIMKSAISLISLCLDIWTDPGLKNSVLGARAHFIDKNRRKTTVYN